MRTLLLSAAAAVLLAAPAWPGDAGQKKPSRFPDVDYIPTPHRVAAAMLRLAEVKKTDVVYDLGCGDGRIVIAAAQLAGARAYGFEIDPFMVEEARARVKAEKVGHLVTIEERDIFDLDLSSASVVTLYLLPELNLKLLPQLARLKPGSRVVSHYFGIEGYPPDATLTVPYGDGRSSDIYLWRTPLRKAAAPALPAPRANPAPL